MSSVNKPSNRPALAMAWIVTLGVSNLPDILLNELGTGAPEWLFWGKMLFLAGCIAVTIFQQKIRALRPYFIVIGLLYLAEWLLQGQLGNSTTWKSWFDSTTFTSNMLGTQILRLGVAGIMIISMLVIKKKRSEFFLVKGDLSASATPIPLVMSRPEPWSVLGRNLALFLSLGTLIFLAVAGRPSPQALFSALPFLPVVVLFAAMNAFSEEMNYKASFLAVLHNVVGKEQSLLLMAAFFGIGHYYGVPYGLVGVVMAGLLGWVLGKSMLETRGFAWAWFIHFLQDVLIFSFMAIGSITAGGR